MQQNLHLLTNSSVGLPKIFGYLQLTLFLQQSRQFVRPINTNFFNGKLEASIEGYYKK